MKFSCPDERFVQNSMIKTSHFFFFFFGTPFSLNKNYDNRKFSYGFWYALSYYINTDLLRKFFNKYLYITNVPFFLVFLQCSNLCMCVKNKAKRKKAAFEIILEPKRILAILRFLIFLINAEI